MSFSGLKGRLYLSLLLVMAGLQFSCGAEKAADIVLTNGRIYTLNWGEPDAEGKPAANAPFSSGSWKPDASAMAIRDNRIVFVGRDADVEAYIASHTRVIDLTGATVLPGLVDSHSHIAGLGQSLSQLDLVGVATEEEAVDRAVAWAANIPKGEWIVGRGWDEGAWANRYPDMRRLSERLPDHPVCLRGLHGFAVWGNRLAFERAGITAATQAPVGGEIRKDNRGNPSGILVNNATDLLEMAIPAPNTDQRKRHLLAGLNAMAAGGYTTIHDAGVGSENMAALSALAADRSLPIRFYAMLSARDEPLMHEWRERGPLTDPDGLLLVRSVKAYYDGALGSRGARLLADYADLPGHRGVSGNDYGFDKDLVAGMMAAGFQVGIHAIGDAGNRETLDFVASVYESSPQARAGRHRIEHAQVVHPDDFRRFEQLDLIASMEPPHAVEDKTWAEDRIGPERIQGAYAWRTMRRTGVPLTFNSDLPGSDHDIFYGLHAAITRRDKTKSPETGWYPDQNMTPEEAVRGYTSWSAFAAFLEDETGVLAPGRRADVTVMDIDPFELGLADPGKILTGSILLTIANGQVVYEK